MKASSGRYSGHRTGSSVFRAGYAISTVREGMNVYTGTYGQNQGLNFSASVDPSELPGGFRSAGKRTLPRSDTAGAFGVADFAAISPHSGLH